MSDYVHVFVYEDAALSGIDFEPVRDDTVAGTLFHVEGVGSALMLSGQNRVRGRIRKIRADALAQADRAARVADGVYRRVGVHIGNVPCWTWVAGPKLAQHLATARMRGEEQT